MAAKSKFSSTPASVIYSQSWPVPASNSVSLRYAAKAYSNSQKKSYDNSPWNYKPKQQTKRPAKASTSSIKSHSWASSMLSNNYPEWLENDTDVVLDMAKEFKITLQMFKKLTDQVKEVDEQLNSGRKNYSFKHYFSNKNRHNAHRRKMRTYTPEIPMTNEEYQPCNNFRFKREQQQLAPSHFGIYRKMEESHHTNGSNRKHGIWPLANTEKEKPAKWQSPELFANGNENEDSNQDPKFENEDIQNLSVTEYSDGDISWSSCLEFSDEDNHTGLGYIDPAPEDWEVRKLEELELKYSPDQGGTDPFMTRYLQLRRLEIETVKQENGSSNSLPGFESEVNIKTVTSKGGKKSSSGRKQNTKINSAVENADKNPRRVSKKSGSTSGCALHDSEKYSEEKGTKNLKKEDKNSRKDSKKDTKETKVENSEKTTRCKSSKGRRRVQSCKSRPESYHSSVTYDILEIATSFQPPSIERIKLNSRPVTAKSAKSKGMIPGKTCTSQRRFSLTAGQSLPTDNSDPVVSKSRTSSAKRPSKRNSKRCKSSKF